MISVYGGGREGMEIKAKLVGRSGDSEVPSAGQKEKESGDLRGHFQNKASNAIQETSFSDTKKQIVHSETFFSYTP